MLIVKWKRISPVHLYVLFKINFVITIEKLSIIHCSFTKAYPGFSKIRG